MSFKCIHFMKDCIAQKNLPVSELFRGQTGLHFVLVADDGLDGGDVGVGDSLNHQGHARLPAGTEHCHALAPHVCIERQVKSNCTTCYTR